MMFAPTIAATLERMKLFKFTVASPVLLEGESGLMPSTFQLGAQAGGAVVVDIEATPMGVIVRREGDGFRDLVLTGTGVGLTLHKMPAAQKAKG